MAPKVALAALVFLLASSPAVGQGSPADPLVAEAKKRSSALVQDGFNMTYGWTFESAGERKPLRLEFLVPEAGDEHRVSFWMEAREGEAGVALRGPDGTPIFAWTGRRGEAAFSRALPAGKYVLEIDRTRAAGGHALLGVKGPLVHRCEVSAERMSEVPAAPEKGFRWPYLLYVPKAPAGGRLLVAPNNTGFASDDVELIRAASSCEVHRQAALAEKLGTPLLVPLFPRPKAAGEEDNLYLHALTRAALAAEAPAYRRVDLQLLAMADDARKVLAAKGVAVDARVLLRGFSASGSFVNRFALLHPDRVLAVACGSPGGWPLAPVAKAGGETLRYPVGIADVPSLTGRRLDVQALKGVAWFFFLGEKDANDAVVFRDSFSKADEALVFRLFGPTPVARWKKAEDLYTKAGLDVRFAVYPGVGHEVTPEIEADVAKFFEGALANRAAGR